MDVKMSGGPWQCDWGDGSCDEMKCVRQAPALGNVGLMVCIHREMFQFGSKDGPEKSNEYKYVFDVRQRCPCEGEQS